MLMLASLVRSGQCFVLILLCLATASQQGRKFDILIKLFIHSYCTFPGRRHAGVLSDSRCSPEVRHLLLRGGVDAVVPATWPGRRGPG